MVIKARVRPWRRQGVLETVEREFFHVNPNTSGRSTRRNEVCSSTAVRKYEQHRKKTENSTRYV